MAISEATASANTTSTSTSDVAINSMTLTPGAGDYLAVFSGEITGDQNNSDIFVSIYVNGTQVAHSERFFFLEGSIINAEIIISTHCIVSPGAGEAVDVRWRTSSTLNDMSMDRRALQLFPVGTYSEATATADTTLDSTTFTALNSMTLTPGAGDYLCVFSTSAEGPGATANLEFAVHVNGTIQTHTTRYIGMEGSIPNTSFPVFLACKVSPGAGEAVDIRWRRDTGTGTITCHERTLTLISVDSGDIWEATATATDTATNTTDAVVDSMTLTPGADDYLALCSAGHEYTGAVASTNTIFVSVYVNGTQVTNSERNWMTEDSLDTGAWTFVVNAKVSPGASEAVDVRWRGNDTDSRNAYERTFILVREASAAPAAQFMTTNKGYW